MKYRSSLLILFFIIIQPLCTWGKTKPQFWISGSLGYNTYDMSDINNEIQARNDTLGVEMDKIKGGVGYGCSFGVNVSRFGINLGFERLNASKDYMDSTWSFDYSLPANLYYAGINYQIPLMPHLNLGIGSDVGMISLGGGIGMATDDARPIIVGISGSSLFLKGRIFIDYHFTPSIALWSSAGYRGAKVDEVKIGEKVKKNEDGSNFSISHSGFDLRMGLRFILNP
jgi:hypothetical protein